MFALFGKLGRAPTIRQESRIATATAASGSGTPSRTMYCEIRKHLSRVQIFDHGPFRDAHEHVLAATAVEILAHPIHPVGRATVRMIAKGQERRHVVIGNQPHRAAVATVTTIGSTEGNWTLTTKTDAAKPPIATAHVELGLVDKGTHRG
jgi:hypothetical protein